MSYTKLTDFAAKDTLLSGNPSKLVRGTELGAEFDAIATSDSLNLKSADASTTYVTKVAEQNAIGLTLASVTGTNTIAGNLTPAITSYVTGQTFRFVAAGTNTGAVTIAINGLPTPQAVTKNGSTALTAGDIVAGGAYQIQYDGVRFQLSGAGSSFTGGTVGTAITAPGFTANTTTGVTFSDGSAISSANALTPPVRQTVLSGPVDTNGFAAFGGSTGSTTVTASGTLVVTASNGTTNRQGSITNPSWTGLSTNGTMYLGLTVGSDGTCTPFSTTLAPTYRWGGADVVTSGQRTFNIQEMQMKVGNGSTAAQAYDVFVGEATVAGGVVTAITWYALMGRTLRTQTTLAVSSGYSLNHNIGTTPLDVRPFFDCVTTDANYVTGDRVFTAVWATGGASSGGVPATSVDRTSIRLATPNQTFIVNKTTFAASGFTFANWSYGCEVLRGW